MSGGGASPGLETGRGLSALARCSEWAWSSAPLWHRAEGDTPTHTRAQTCKLNIQSYLYHCNKVLIATRQPFSTLVLRDPLHVLDRGSQTDSPRVTSGSRHIIIFTSSFIYVAYKTISKNKIYIFNYIIFSALFK